MSERVFGKGLKPTLFNYKLEEDPKSNYLGRAISALKRVISTLKSKMYSIVEKICHFVKKIFQTLANKRKFLEMCQKNKDKFETKPLMRLEYLDLSGTEYGYNNFRKAMEIKFRDTTNYRYLAL